MLKVNTSNAGFSKEVALLKKALRFSQSIERILHYYGSLGVMELSRDTPRDTGVTANSWTYEILKTRAGYNISWSNRNRSQGVPIVILLVYGHATSTGGFVQGRDFVTPVLESLILRMNREIELEVRRFG